MLPTVFHEIAHHFRYEDRSEKKLLSGEICLEGMDFKYSSADFG